MRTGRQWVMALMAVALVVGWVGTEAAAKGNPALNACNANLETCITTLETCPIDLGACNTDLTQAEADLSTCTAQLAAAQHFPATGQTSCWNSAGGSIACAGTGQDGDIRAGATLSYTDNGDGTITDNNTKLVWEKKDDNNVGGIHDKDTSYTWGNAFAVHIAQLNNRCANDETVDCTTNGDGDCSVVGGACGFAGHRDWRLPTIKELQSIVNYENTSTGGGPPAVSPAFNNCAADCTVVACSCTLADRYWSSTSYAPNAVSAWLVDFGAGFSDTVVAKSNTFPVRAVRGGL